MVASEVPPASTRVFLSHAGADAAAARSFAEILRRNDVDVWLDTDSLQPGDRWMVALEEAIENSAGMLVYIDRLGVQNWIDREVRFGLELNTRDPKAFKLIPVLGDGAEVHRLPPFLRQQQSIAVRDPAAIQQLLRVLRGGDAMPAVRPEYWRNHSPFRSLQSFDPDDAWLFFGRDRDTDEVLARLQRSRVLVLIGNSGSGKSSLVMAGVIPALQRGRFYVDDKVVASWHLATIRPSANPFGELVDSLARQLASDVSPADRDALITRWRTTFPTGGEAVRNGLAALTSAPGQTLLFVDQFEELFTLVAEPVRDRYIEALLRTAESERVHLIIGLRADFYGPCLAYESLRPHLQSNYSLLLMKRDQLREAIEKRLALSGSRADDGLTEALLADAGSEPGNLALLEHALALLWEQDSGKYDTPPLTNRRYEEIGRLKGAIGKHAHTVCTSLTPEQQRLARRIFVELVHVGEGAQDTRRRVKKQDLLELETTAAVAPLLETLAAKRLIAITGDHIEEQNSSLTRPIAFVEVSHESLIREWPDLRSWLREDRDDLRFGQRLSTEADEWGRTEDSSALLRGARLLKAEEWLGARTRPPETIRSFVSASRALERAEQENQEQARKERETQLARIAAEQVRTASAQRFSRWVLATVAVLLVLIGAGILSENRDLSRQRSRVLVGNSDEAIERGIYDRALRLAVLAAESTWLFPGTADAEAQLYRASEPSLQRLQLNHDGPVLSAAVSQDGQRIVTASNHTARVWDAATGKEIARLSHDEAVLSAVFSRNGQHIVTVSANHTAHVWDTATGKEIARLTDVGKFMSPGISRDGQRIVAVSVDGTAHVWDATTGKEIAPLAHGDTVNSAAFSEDGQRIVTASSDRTARIWDATTGKEITRFAHDDRVNSASFSHDEQRIVTASSDRTARIWDATTGKEIARLPHVDPVSSAVFSQDGQRVVTVPARFDSIAYVWDSTTGKEIARLAHDDFSVNSVAFSPNGRSIVTASDDAMAHVWDATTGKEIVRFAHGARVSSASFSQDGQRIVTASDDATARVWDATTSKEVARFAHDDSVNSAAFSQDGQRIVTASNHMARVWDATTGKEIARLAHDDTVNSAAFSQDGQRIVTASNHTTRVWDAMTGKEIARLAHDDTVNSAAFSHDGQRIVTASDDTTARVWDATSGKEIARLAHIDRVLSAAFSQNGRRIVTASDSTARVWDATIGREIARSVHDLPIHSAVFSQDGQRIVTGAGDDTVRVWDATTGKEIARFAHDSSVKSAVFSQDGQRILSGSFDGMARIWDVTTGKEIGRFVHDLSVTSAVFSQDGQRIVTGSVDHTARVWDASWLRLHDSTLKEAACSRLIGADRLTAGDTSAAPVLSGREGEGVCQATGFLKWLVNASRRIRQWAS